MKRAETLIEVVIAISILGIVAPISAGLVMLSQRTTTTERNLIVAKNLAEDGVNIFASFKETNLIRFSPKAEQCWNTKPEHNDLETCELPENRISAGIYRLKLNPDTLAWELEPNPNQAVLTPQLTAPASDVWFQLKEDPVTHFYNYDNGTSTPYYRELLIASDDADDDPATIENLEVISRVVYRVGGRVHTRSSSRTITSD